MQLLATGIEVNAVPCCDRGYRHGFGATALIGAARDGHFDIVTLLLAVDFSAAFDRAWRARLPQKLLDRGFPPAVVRWIRAFFSERIGKVRIADVLSRGEFEI